MKREDLKQFDGKAGHPAYFAYKGKVYDISGSKLWKNGTHLNRHHAGEDLTDFLSMAPHAEEVLQQCEVVGTLDDEIAEDISIDRMEVLRDWYRRFHPHPVTLHYPMGLFYFAAFMQLLYLVFRVSSFEHSAFYAFVGGTLTTIPAGLSGMFSWWVNYQMTLTRIFRTKIIFTLVMLVFGISGCILRFLYPEISSGTSPLSLGYNALLFLNVPVLTIVAFNGGKITWPS